MTLAKKVFLSALIIAIVSVVAILYFVLVLVRSSATEAAITQQTHLTQQTMNSIDKVLGDNFKQLEALGNDDMIAAAATPVSDVKAKANAAEKFKELAATTGSWESLELITLNQKIAAKLEGGTSSMTFSTTAYQIAFEAAGEGRVAYSDVVPDPQTGRPTMLFAVPVRDDEFSAAPVRGVIMGRLSWSLVLDLLQQNGAHNAVLFNHEGLTLGDNNPKHTANKLALHPSTSGTVQQALRNKSGALVTASVSGGAEALVSYVQEKGTGAYKGNDWLLVIETPATEAFAFANKFGTVTPIAFVILVGGTVIIFMLLLNRVMVRPLRQLSMVTQRIAAGDFTQRANIASKDEFGQLGVGFNRMATRLQDLYRDLEAKVEEKTAQLAQRVSESETARARDEAIMGAMGEGLIALDEQGKVGLVNVRAAELFGIPRDVLFGRQLTETLVDLRGTNGERLQRKDRPEYMAGLSKQAITEVYTYQQRDGSKIAVTINATPILRENRVVGVVLVARDVTKEKEVDRMKTEFIALASHQLRTPLSAIRWFNEMLLAGDAGELNKEQHEFAQNVAGSTERMIELVGSLLNISRIESGRIIVDPVPTDLNELINGIVNDLQAKIAEKQQHLVVSVHAELPKVNLDPKLIGQVYMNFLTNAIRYTPQGGDISVFVSRKGEDVVSQVTDTGYGIPKAQQGKVFQKFFRADNAVKVAADGTGLGLYLVKAIIESSGGKVWFESEEGKGTSFWFSIPMSGMKARAGEVTLNS